MPGPGSRRRVGGKAKKGTFRRLMKSVFSVNKSKIIIILMCIAITSVASIVTSTFLKNIIDNVIEPCVKNKLPFSAVSKDLLFYLLLMVSLYLVALIASTISSLLLVELTQGYLKTIRNNMFDSMEKLPIKYFDRNLRGDIMSTYTNDVDALRQLISQSLPQLIGTFISVTSVFLLMLYYSIWLTLVVVFATIFIFYATMKIGGGSAKYFIKQQKSVAQVEGFIEEMMNGQKVVKVFTHEEKSIEDFDKLNDALYEDTNKANKYGNILGPIIHNIGNILYVLVAIVGVSFSLNNIPNLSFEGFFQGKGFITLSLGTAVTFLTMSRQFANSFGQVSQQINSVVMALAGASRIFDLLDQQEEQDEGYVKLVNIKFDDDHNIIETNEHTGHWAWKHPHNDGRVTYTELKGDIVLENVDFGYSDDKIVLHDVSVYARPGQKIALVGSTGAGKTTITNLITRFYDLQDGKLRFDGININKICKSDLRKSIGMVLQDTSLFTGTVKDNIKYGKLDATDDEVYQAAKVANAYDFITRLPEGFDTVLTNDGANLSQGQRQLLSIARCAIADAPVLILDEATSSIDTRTEKIVQDGMDKLMQGRTVFVIAHRLSTIQNADCIMVLEHGRIIEKGNHEDLINKKGTYYQLYTGAFELD